MTREPPFDSHARQWLREQIERGCSRREIADILFQQGYSVATVRAQMGAAYPEVLTQSTEPLVPPPILRRPRRNLHRVDTEKLELYVLEDFMSANDCDRLAALIRHHLNPSPVAGTVTDADYRTSRTCFLSHLRSPLAVKVNQRICTIMGINPEYSEGIQAQHYETGQQFKAHRDFFISGSVYRQNGPELGNRTWSFMVYLNEGMGGGGTRFHVIDQVFEPRKGRALFWNNLYPDRRPNWDTLHSGEPVTSGHKVIITKWFREFGAGKMFLD
ncbi:MAG TPA: 2OG-Fe(II) oxygenase [Steroidobacteraceae bacterium]|nr:2OG-Fe(II) oxygenase [Steroidobacteraceae bacterium]